MIEINTEHKIKTIIVDDEPLARKGLVIRLSEFTDVEIIGQCHNGVTALEMIKQEKPKLVFLDIQMPGMTGFDVMKHLHDEMPAEDWPIVVFVTAYDQYALKAFEVHALDYLLKPVNDERLQDCISKVRGQINSDSQNENQTKLVNMVAQLIGADSETILQNLADGEFTPVKEYSSYIAVKDVGETTRIPVKEVIWVDAAGDYMCVHCSDGETHILRKTMKQLEQELDPSRFIRVHRSVIVNSTEVSKVLTLTSGEYVIQLTNKHEIRVSRSYRDKVRTALL